MDLFTSAKELAAEARTQGRDLKLTTLSGTVYLLHPSTDGEWLISRFAGGRTLTSLEWGRVFHEEGGRGLIVGSWETTGLRMAELV